MAPFYSKEGETWRKWRREPKDIRDKEGNFLGVSIYPAKDPEQIQISVPVGGAQYVIGERGNVVFPGQTVLLNRDSFNVVDARTRKTIAKVTHRKK